MLTLQPCLRLSRNFTRSFSIFPPLQSGHNKWSKIKQRKGANDAQKGQLYGRATRDIMIASRLGGSADPELNTALAAVIKRYKSQGVPKDNLESAIKKAAGGKDAGEQAATYEAMAGTVGVIIECLTNNPTRTATKVREQLRDHNARLAPVGFLFERKGSVRVSLDREEKLEDKLEHLVEAAFDANAEDFERDDSSGDTVEVEFICDPSSLSQLTEALSAPGVAKELLNSELVYLPLEKVDSPDEELTERISNLVDSLEELEDTMRVWTTLDS